MKKIVKSKKYQPVIGLEVHVQLKTESKMFCGCKNNSEEKKPNFNVCPICLGHPGTLPVINKEAVKKVLKTAKALNCQIAEISQFSRKSYFYPDLPKGYQISQYDLPLSEKGELNKIRIRRIHLEEDTGRLIHKNNKTLIDFNRSGAPLMELVTEPDIKSAKQAKKFCQDLQLILRYLKVSDANMEKGEMRCEVNVSLKGKGPKVEIKNLNSFKAVEKSIEYETKRQTNAKKIIQETRGWDENKQETFSQRSKESAHDYRYFPEPDLPPLKLSVISYQLSEMPQAKKARFLKEYNLPEQDINILIQNKNLADYFEQIASELENKKLIKLAVNYLIKIKDNFKKITGENFAEFIGLINQGEISSSAADIILHEMQKTGGDPSQIIEAKDLKQESDLDAVIKKIINNNPKAIQDFKAGKKQALKFLIGKIMFATRGKANPQIAEKILLGGVIYERNNNNA
ncbi:MAG: Asp-tRNA(Asn)/Glu-tRNA(Gln) amidotransferase subunit GatB [bacterium]